MAMTNEVRVRIPTMDHRAARRERRECVVVAMVGAHVVVCYFYEFKDLGAMLLYIII